MRERKEIEGEAGNRNNRPMALVVEVLLDIRDLLFDIAPDQPEVQLQKGKGGYSK